MRIMRLKLFAAVAMLLSVMSCEGRVPDVVIPSRPQEPETFGRYYDYAMETLAQTDRDFGTGGLASYFETLDRDSPSYIWGNIFLLYTYNELYKLDNVRGKQMLDKCFENLERHWCPDFKGKAGYSTSPVENAAAPDRFYDENGWMSWGLSEAYRLTGDQKFLERAKDAYDFTMSGEDEVLGGGIYFKEVFSGLEPQKNTICSAVAIMSAMNLFECTGDRKYVDDAERIHSWTYKNLYDRENNLFWDARMTADGRINTAQWSYNSCFMIKGWLKMYDATGKDEYRELAEATMDAAMEKWFDRETGALRDPGCFAFTLVECFLIFYERQKDERWLSCSRQAADYVHTLRDASGRYPEYWDCRPSSPGTQTVLMHSTSVAYLYMMLADSDSKND